MIASPVPVDEVKGCNAASHFPLATVVGIVERGVFRVGQSQVSEREQARRSKKAAFGGRVVFAIYLHVEGK